MCPYCRKELIHKVYMINIKKGLKLKCSGCDRIINRYFKVSNLKEVERRSVDNGKTKGFS
jgi:ribosomal protein L44E